MNTPGLDGLLQTMNILGARVDELEKRSAALLVRVEAHEARVRRLEGALAAVFGPEWPTALADLHTEPAEPRPHEA